jgi:hypothetical protein
MDTLIYIPFSLWGLNPFISKNLNYIFQRPIIKDIEIIKSSDYGLILRKETIKADSLPISTIYSIQYPKSNYSQYGVGFSRFIKNFLISSNYDYNDNFKQASLSFDYKKLNLSYFETFKLSEHLQFLYFGISNFLKINYQVFNDTSLYYFQIFYSKFIYSDFQKEGYFNLGFSKNLLKLSGGVYYNFKKDFYKSNYELNLDLNIIKIGSRYFPFEFNDTIYNSQKHFIEFSYKFLSFSYTYHKNLTPFDTFKFSFSKVQTLNANLKFKFFNFSIFRNFGSSIEWISNLKAFYEFYPRKDILIKPYLDVLYIENQFSNPIEDIFNLKIGISFELFGGLYLDFQYNSNLFFESLWENSTYGLILRISLED